MMNMKNASRSLRHIFSLGSAMCCMLLAFAACKKNEVTFFQIQSWFGSVKISTDKGDIVPEVGQYIGKGTTIATGANSIVDIKCGTSGVMRINENTKVMVSKLFDPKDPKARETNLELAEGKVFMGISKLEKGSNLLVKTPTAVAAVRGTSFRVSAEEGEARIDVLSGKIKVNPVKDGAVVQEVETVVEKNSAVTMDEKKVDEVIAKKEIKTEAIKAEEVKEIQQEADGIKIDKSVDKEVVKEIEDAGIKSEIINLEEKDKEAKKRAEEEARRADELKKQKEKEEELAKAKDNAIKRKAEYEKAKSQKKKDEGISVPSLE